MLDKPNTFVVNRPEDINRIFAIAYNSGNLDGLLSLYETEARLVNHSNAIRIGTTAIRDTLHDLLKLGGQMISENQYAIVADNIALIRANWTIVKIDLNGEKTEVRGQSAEIVRRQTDGSWKYVIDHPFGAN